MKKQILFLLLTASVVAASAQTGRFGITAGATFSSTVSKVEDETEDSETKPGFTVGLTGDLPLTENFSVRPGLYFTQKGGKAEGTYGGFSGESKTTFNYIEVPLNFVYNAPAGSGKFFIGLGPAIAYGIGGKTEYKFSAGGYNQEGEENVNFGNNEDEDDLKPFEVSGNILAGYELANGVFISANYNLGLSNLVINGNDNNSAKNRYFGIRLGYMLGSK